MTSIFFDLTLYREGKGRDAVRLLYTTSGFLHVEHDEVLSRQFHDEATRARAEFRELTVATLYERSC